MAGPITSATGQYLQAIAFAVTGVAVMISAAPHILWLMTTAFMNMGSAFAGAERFIEPVAQFLFGLALFLQSKGLSLLWHKIRAGGVMQPGATRDEVAP
jgi:hypothetical protein